MGWSPVVQKSSLKHKDRITRDKKKIDEESARAKELMQKKLADLPEGAKQSEGRIAWKGDVFDQVLNKEERHGRVRGVGLGVCPTSLFGPSLVEESSYDHESNAISPEYVQKLLAEMQQNHAEELRVMNENHDKQMEVLHKQDRLEKNIEELCSMLRARASEEGHPIIGNQSANLGK